MKLVFLCLLFLVASCNHQSQEPSEPQTVPVKTEVAIVEALPTTIILPGTTRSVHTVEIQARVEGWLNERHFVEGSMVQAGDVLYEIDSSQYIAQLHQAEASLASAEASASFARSELERNKPLLETGAISAEHVDQLNSSATQAEAQVDAATAALELAELNVHYCSIYSPISGTVGKTTVDVGSLVGPGISKTLCEVVTLNPMYVELYPPANRLAMMQHSIQARERMPIHLTVTENVSEGQPSKSKSEMKKETITGSIVFVDNEIQSSTSTVLARGEFVNTANLIPGQYVEVSVQLQIDENAIMIPTKSVMQQPGSYYVWTISNDNQAVITPVTLGAILGNRQHVLSGLREGDAVIVEGTRNLRSGQQVTVTSGQKVKP